MTQATDYITARHHMRKLVEAQCEQAFKTHRRPVPNPYPPGSDEYRTWNMKWGQLTQQSIDTARANLGAVVS